MANTDRKLKKLSFYRYKLSLSAKISWICSNWIPYFNKPQVLCAPRFCARVRCINALCNFDMAICCLEDWKWTWCQPHLIGILLNLSLGLLNELCLDQFNQLSEDLIIIQSPGLSLALIGVMHCLLFKHP